MLDYIIVGAGLAGIAFCENAIKNNKTFIVFNNDTQNSSKVAAGLYNPVILKRFSQVWHASNQLEILKEYYAHLELKLNCKFDHELPIYRKLFSVEEQNNWFLATDKPGLSEFLSSRLITKKNASIDSEFCFGELLKTGFVDTKLLLSEYVIYLQMSGFYSNETFEYSKLNYFDDFVTYNNLKARHILFAEGFGNKWNPFFNYLPVDGTKGELLLIKAPNLNLKEIINSSIYLIPIGNDLYKVGATYNWEDKSNVPTEEGKIELLNNLKSLINCDFEIIDHLAGVRPTVKDRRPLAGTHPKFKRYHILNGLGTRGVMIAPELAVMLYNHIENQEILNDHVNIKRFEKLISNSDYI